MLDAGVSPLTGTQGSCNEQELIRQLIEQADMGAARIKSKVRASATTPLDQDETVSRTRDSATEASIKLCQRIWSGYTKFLRS